MHRAPREPAVYRWLRRLREAARSLRARTPRQRLDAWCEAVTRELEARPWYLAAEGMTW